MNQCKRVVLSLIAAGALVYPGLATAQEPGASRQGGRRGGAAASGPAAGPAAGRGAGAGPAFAPARLSTRLENWGRLRTAALGLLGWKIGVAAGSFRQLTFSEAVAKADALNLANIEGVNTQEFSREIPKKLDYNLAPGEVTAVTDRLRSYGVQMPVYFTPTMSADESIARKLFQFAKTLGVDTIVSAPEPESLAMIDKLANEYGVNVALCNCGGKGIAYRNPESLLQAMQGRSKRIGAYADIGYWMQEGIKPIEALAQLKDRVRVVNLRDRNVPGAKGHDVTLGNGAAGLPELMRDVQRAGLRPTLITVDATGAPDVFADLSRSLEGLEKAIGPIVAEQVDRIARTSPILLLGESTPAEEKRKMEPQIAADLARYQLTIAELMQKIESALPKQAPAKPKKSRTLLVMDLNVGYGGHVANRFALNYAVELIGRKTGAYQTVFSNSLDNLKYDKIKQFDAVFLNNTVGTLFVDPEVREGLLRFVREGGGLAGNHGTSHASMDWTGFAEMMGTYHGIHRENDEQAMLRIDDPRSPLNASFGGKEFLYRDEIYRFPDGPFSREKSHVLLSVDVEKTDMNQGRACAQPCTRPDNDYAISWIRSYGKGRIFYSVLGHQPVLFATPPLAAHFLAAIQFVLGDLEADTTPSAKLSKGK